jgi:uncharacterized phosphosugar-binding protein
VFCAGSVLAQNTGNTGEQSAKTKNSRYAVRQFFDISQEILLKIIDNEMENIEKATDLMAASIKEGRLIHVFGTGGHNVMAAMEIFKRAGSLVPINPLFPPGISVADARPSTERLLGYARMALVHYNCREGDVIIVINCNGINPVTIEAAVEARKMGLKVIAVTSSQFSRGVPPSISARHPSNQDLCDLGDVVVDSHVPLGDAVVEVDNFDLKVSSVSTMANTFIVQSLVAMTVDKLVKMGVAPEVWASANVEGGTENNRKYRQKYQGRIQHLAFY